MVTEAVQSDPLKESLKRQMSAADIQNFVNTLKEKYPFIAQVVKMFEGNGTVLADDRKGGTIPDKPTPSPDRSTTDALAAAEVRQSQINAAKPQPELPARPGQYT